MPLPAMSGAVAVRWLKDRVAARQCPPTVPCPCRPRDRAAKSERMSPEHVFGDHHIEALRALHKVERRRIHVTRSVATSRELRAATGVKNLPEENHRRQHVGLVHQRGHACAADGPGRRRGAEQPLRTAPGIRHFIARFAFVAPLAGPGAPRTVLRNSHAPANRSMCRQPGS